MGLALTLILTSPSSTSMFKSMKKGMIKIIPEKILRVVLNNEGGYTDNPKDTGGKTKYGVTEYTLKKAIKDGVIPEKEVRELTIKDAAKIYDYRYWITCRANLMPEPLNLVHFDTAVLHGNGGANRILQRTLTSMGFPITIDGGYGSETHSAFKAALQVYGQDKIIRMYLIKRKLYTQEIRTPRNEWAFNGWMNRLYRLANYVKNNYPVDLNPYPFS